MTLPENHVCALLKYFVITILHKEQLVVKIFYYPLQYGYDKRSRINSLCIYYLVICLMIHI